MDAKSRPKALSALRRGLRPAMPVVIGAAALTFLFAAVMPLAWVGGISWNLYLDRLSALFDPPVGNGGRLALALGMAVLAAIVAGLVALALTKPAVSGNRSMNRRVAARARQQADEDPEQVPPRRRADRHPDDLERPPIRAERDLPAAGLGPASGAATMPQTNDADELDLAFAERADEGDWAEQEGELILADIAPADDAEESDGAGDEPWLQPVPAIGRAMPDPADTSLGAMVARFEAGLARRSAATEGETAAGPASPVRPPANEDGEPAVDFALEAALSTLQRMSRSAVG